MTKPKADRKAEVEGRDENGQFAAGNAGGPGSETIYTDALGAAIAELLADGVTVNEISRMMGGTPAARTIRRWALDLEHPFAPLYTRAREIGYHSMADDVIDIADDGRNDWMKRNGEGDQGWVVNGEHVARSRIRFDARRWLLSKALPKIYGDKLALTDPDGNKLVVEIVHVDGE